MSEEQKTDHIDIEKKIEDAPAEIKAEGAEKVPGHAGHEENRERGGYNRERGGKERDGRRRERGGDSQDQRMPKFRKKVCRFCNDKNATIDYKRSDILEKFITDRGKILPRRVTGTCSKHQRAIAKAIKCSRMIALLPFIEQ